MIIPFLLVAALNLVVLLLLLRWRGISIEGICLFYLLLSIVTDHAWLLYKFIFTPHRLLFGEGEFDFRVYPTIVNLVVLVSFGVGLYLADHRPSPVTRIGRRDDVELFRIGAVFVLIGLGLSVAGILLVGAASAENFYLQFDTFRSEELPYGGFWYRGADITNFGLALILMASRLPWKFGLAVIGLMLSISFFLTANKGGSDWVLVSVAVIYSAFDRIRFRRVVRLKVLLPIMLFIFIFTGVKVFYRKEGFGGATPGIGEVAERANNTIAARFSDEGLYRGYAMMINYLDKHPNLHWDGRVAKYTLVSWVPRLLYPNKPDHPFRRIGFMINPDYHTYDRECSAPMLGGYAFADFGWLSALGYPLIGGIFFGLLRRWWGHTHAPMSRFIIYLCTTLLGAASAEVGFLNVFYAIGFSVALMVVAKVVNVFLFMPSRQPELLAPKGRVGLSSLSRPHAR